MLNRIQKFKSHYYTYMQKAYIRDSEDNFIKNFILYFIYIIMRLSVRHVSAMQISEIHEIRLKVPWAVTYTTAMQPNLFHFVLYKSMAPSWT